MGSGNSKSKEDAKAAKEDAKRKKEEEKAAKQAAKEEAKRAKEDAKAEKDGASGKKKKVNDKLAARMSLIEGAVGGPQVSVAEIDATIKRIIANDKKLTELNMNNNSAFAKMGKEAKIKKHREIADALAKNTVITSVLMVNCQLEDASAEAFADALVENATVTSLNLESNYITGIGVLPIAKMLSTNKTLKELRLNNQRQLISTEAEEALMNAMATNETLVRLNLDIRNLQAREKVQRQLALNMDRQRQQRVDDRNTEELLASLTPLQRKIMSVVSNNYDKDDLDISTDLEFTKMKEDEKVGLANGMAKNTRIKTLKINKVQLKDSFAEAMGKALETNTTLEVLSMESNTITGVGIIALANSLKANTTLRELKLQGQAAPASTEAEEALVAMFDANNNLLKLGLQIRDATARERIDKALRRNADLVRQARKAGK